MSLSEAMKEAYAEPDLETVVYETLELNHPAFDEAQFFVANVDDDMVLGGRLHKAVGVTLQLVGFDDDGQTSGQLAVENISGLLVPHLQNAVKAGSSIDVVYRAYTQANRTVAGEVRAGLLLSKVSLNETTATGTLEPASKHDTQAFPRFTYSVDKFKALNGA